MQPTQPKQDVLQSLLPIIKDVTIARGTGKSSGKPYTQLIIEFKVGQKLQYFLQGTEEYLVTSELKNIK